MDRDVAHDLYRSVDFLHLLRDLADAPVSISFCFVALVWVQRAEVPICDGTQFCDQILALSIRLDRM